ncbi:MAG TPA: bifunctional phosphoribosylaminoimidazolecarboxamide formyltransferase/IMP cyclohydrolase [Thermoanaerobaculia bacterium]|nr:bifunctional phosphoribosylaminoimidazolecarboxamide formyltransferase/IMP cyclohydrolase [Thermoanaerobaculia bacterium]
MLPARRALLSVSDKRGLADFARGLDRLGIEIVSTGGTHQHLQEAGVPVIPVDQVTGFPEILDGRVKTLHPAIHGGIVADRERSSHLSQLEQHGIQPIDLVVVNLYPFQATVERGASFAETVEMIDIGGPCMVRAAAKNHAGVVVVVDPDDYPQVLAGLDTGGGVLPEPMRRRLALKAFRHTQAYDAAIAAWLGEQVHDEQGEEGADAFPRVLRLDLVRELEPRYGENPHQPAAVYRSLRGGGLFGGFRQLQGKELSWNNLLDADAARRLVALLDQPAVVIVKHNNPCGVGVGEDLVEAYRRALECDPVSAFGSIVALNRAASGALAEVMAELFVEVVIAPGVDDDAAARFAAKKNLRVLDAPPYAGAGETELRAIDGGFLAQASDSRPEDPSSWECPTRTRPNEGQRRALELMWKVCRHVKSNAIVLGNEVQTVGIGAGQMSRVDSCRLAIEKAQLPVAGAVAASDAFFPFRDGVDTLAAAGVEAIVQPGGSKRDDEVIAAADEAGMAMLFTGRRHFKH